MSTSKLKVGITGGMGAGKTFIAGIFSLLGIPIYNADREAKKLMNESPIIRTQIIEAFGENAYKTDGKLNRPFLRKAVFGDEKGKALMEGIVHPAIASHYDDWHSRQLHCPYTLKEAAILFENGSYEHLDAVICVVAEENIRIERILSRDRLTLDQIKRRLSNQWTDEQKTPLADYIIENNPNNSLLEQVLHVHHSLKTKNSNL